MDRRGIAPLIIVVIIVVVAVVAGIGIYVATRGGGAGGGGGVPGGLSLYPESQSWEIPSNIRENMPSGVGINYAGYTVSRASVQDVLNWYKGQMTGWTLEVENMPVTLPGGAEMRALIYRKDNDAAVIVAGSGTGLPSTCYILLTAPWSMFESGVD